MPAVVIDDHTHTYYCPSCDRDFNSAASIYQHCEDTSLHSWCANCQLTFHDDQALHQHLHNAQAHCTCDECGATFRNADLLGHHMGVHNNTDWECVSCEKTCRSASGMINHLEIVCGDKRWNQSSTEHALSFFAERHPVDYGIRVVDEQYITCRCRGKAFSTASALCQHLESETCEITWDGEEVVAEFVRILCEGQWIKGTRRRQGWTLTFDNTLARWDDER